MQIALLQKAIIAKRNLRRLEKLYNLLIFIGFFTLNYWHAECTV